MECGVAGKNKYLGDQSLV